MLKIQFGRNMSAEALGMTDKQQGVIDAAIPLLEKYDKEEVAGGGYIFEYNGEMLLDEDYECCDNEKCATAVMKNIRKDIGKYKRIKRWWIDNCSDYDKIYRCSVCNRPLNNSLTWIYDEFYHHKLASTTRERLMQSGTAFDVRIMLESLPSNDCKDRVDIADVIAYAKKVIRLLGNNRFDRKKKRGGGIWDIVK